MRNARGISTLRRQAYKPFRSPGDSLRKTESKVTCFEIEYINSIIQNYSCMEEG